MRKYPIRSHITPVATAGWESFKGTSLMLVACLGAWAVLGAAYYSWAS
jgi:hypothetical protein